MLESPSGPGLLGTSNSVRPLLASACACRRLLQLQAPAPDKQAVPPSLFRFIPDSFVGWRHLQLRRGVTCVVVVVMPGMRMRVGEGWGEGEGQGALQATGEGREGSRNARGCMDRQKE